VRTSSSGRHITQKVVGRSRDRGRKGHRILRRVLVGGRHLGLSRAIAFHEAVVTATLAASPHGKVTHARKSKSKENAFTTEGSPKGHRTFRGSGKRRQRCQRLDRNGRRGQRTSTPESSASRDAKIRGARQCVSSCDPPKRSECREAFGPLASRTEPKTPWGVHAMKVAERTRNARGTGIRSIIQVAEVGRTHRAPCPSQGRKTR
jgi:hypothetical protein